MAKTHRERKIDSVIAGASGILHATGNADLDPGLPSLVVLLLDALPPRTRLQGEDRMADIAAWHAIKTAGRAVDAAAFRAASPAGDVHVAARKWLLDYTRYLPVAARSSRHAGDPAAMLGVLKAGYPLVHMVALDLLPAVQATFPQLLPRAVASIATVLACKVAGRHDGRDVLATGSFMRQSSVFNAIRRRAATLGCAPADLAARLVDAGTTGVHVSRRATAGGDA